MWYVTECITAFVFSRGTAAMRCKMLTVRQECETELTLRRAHQRAGGHRAPHKLGTCLAEKQNKTKQINLFSFQCRARDSIAEC